jgi:two-component system nitrate/nitrite response regulator NarL
MIKVLLADDHEIITDGLKSILKNEDNIEVVATVSNGRDAVNYIEKNQVDIAVLDINMPIMTGIEATKLIKENAYETKVLILSMYDTMEFIDELIEAGCQGYILKNKGQEELVKAIHRVYSGKPYFGERVQERMLEQRMNSKIKSKQEKVDLTRRELQVLQLIAQEFTTPEISEKLFIEESTVNTHRRNLISKLGVKSSLGLVSYAWKNGIIK